MGRPPVDIIGERFGTLTALRPVSLTESGENIWECECDCGDNAYSTASDLKRGRFNICPSCEDKKSRNSPLKGLYGNYRRGAENRDLSFNLSLEEFGTITAQSCEYCGSPPTQVYKKENAKHGVVYNGIDRKDNSVGYEPSNVVPCCKFCNFAKSRFPVDEFMSWLDRISANKKPK